MVKLLVMMNQGILFLYLMTEQLLRLELILMMDPHQTQDMYVYMKETQMNHLDGNN